MSTIESHNRYAPPDLGYLHFGPGSDIFAKYYPTEPPRQGFKLHVSAQPQDAEIVARSVLPKLRQRRVWHKVVKDLRTYMHLCTGEQRGKFITIYTGGADQAQEILNAIDPELTELRSHGGIRPGPIPHTRQSNHQEAEINVGTSGMIYTYWYEDGDTD